MRSPASISRWSCTASRPCSRSSALSSRSPPNTTGTSPWRQTPFAPRASRPRGNASGNFSKWLHSLNRRSLLNFRGDSMLQSSLIDLASCNGTRSDRCRLAFLRLRTVWAAAGFKDTLLRWSMKQEIAKVKAWKFRAQKVMDSTATKAPMHLCDLNDLAAQLQRGLVFFWRITITFAGEAHKATRAALR